MSVESGQWLLLVLALPLAGAVSLLKAQGAESFASRTLAALWAQTAAALGVWLTHAGKDSQLPGVGTVSVDALAAPMIPVLAFLHLLTLLGTAKSDVTRTGCVRVLLSSVLTPLLFCCVNGGMLIGTMALFSLLPAWDLLSGGRPARVFLLYFTPFLLLLASGWLVRQDVGQVWTVGLLLLALKLCGGIFPLHGWMPSLFQRASFAAASLFVLPMVEVVATVRLVLPSAPAWMLESGSWACMATAIYASGMAVVQADARRFFAFLALSKTSLVMFGVLSGTLSGLTASLCLWGPVVLCLAGLGYSLRALESRFGRLSLAEHHGHYDQVPGLALVFLVSGLGVVGFPGTVGFVPMELLISGSFQHGLWACGLLAAVALLNGVSMLRAYFAFFTGKRPATSVSLRETSRERVGIVLILVAVIFAGWFSPSVVEARHELAERLLAPRARLP